MNYGKIKDSDMLLFPMTRKELKQYRSSLKSSIVQRKNWDEDGDSWNLIIKKEYDVIFKKIDIVLKSEAEPDIIFYVNDNKEILKLCPNGDIFVKGKLAENDKEVVDAMREFLKVNTRQGAV